MKNYILILVISGGIFITLTAKAGSKDTIPPFISLIGKDTVKWTVYKPYRDSGATATDNHDAHVALLDSTNINVNRLGIYHFIYYAIDSAGNKALPAKRTVMVVDNVRPIIKLIGQINVDNCRWCKYVDSGYTVSDNYSKLTGKNLIKIDTLSNVNVSNPAVYYTYYIATDSSGNQSKSQIRNIFISEDGACMFNQCTSNIAPIEKPIQYSLSPNPTIGQFTLDMDETGQAQTTIIITNTMGQIIKRIQNETGNQKIEIDLGNVPAGVYFVNIVAGDKRVTGKVLVER